MSIFVDLSEYMLASYAIEDADIGSDQCLDL